MRRRWTRWNFTAGRRAASSDYITNESQKIVADDEGAGRSDGVRRPSTTVAVPGLPRTRRRPAGSPIKIRSSGTTRPSRCISDKHSAKLVAAIWLADSSAAPWRQRSPPLGGGPAADGPLPADSCCHCCPSLHVTRYIAMDRRASIRSLGESCARQKGAASYSWRLLELRAGAQWVLRRRAQAVGGGQRELRAGGQWWAVKQRAAWPGRAVPAPAAKSAIVSGGGHDAWTGAASASQELCCLAGSGYKEMGRGL